MFFCHAGDQKLGLVSVIKEYLRLSGISSFLDIHDLVSGQRTDETIKPALLAAPCVVIVISDEFLKRDYPMKELQWLIEADQLKKTVPVFLQRTRMQTRQHVSCSEGTAR
jgi:hypothetical protein